jgi:hypothetical protein
LKQVKINEKTGFDKKIDKGVEEENRNIEFEIEILDRPNEIHSDMDFLASNKKNIETWES